MRDYLADIARCYRGREEFQDLLVAAIREARAAGVSWAKIGAAMDMTYQGARQRYQRIIEEQEPEAADA